VIQKVASEDETKAMKEEQWKKYEESQNNNASLMDTYIPNISTGGSSSHTQFSGLDLGLSTPYRPSKVPNLKNF
jgi:hypothetical protein